MRRSTKSVGRLSPQQNYLLQRIPSTYDMDDSEEKQVEPVEVKKARKLIEQWDKQESLRRCQAKKRNEALIRKAREAVYFEEPEKALAIVKQCEKLLKGCPV